MAQIATTIRLDSELKSRFERLCEELGMSFNTAVNVFVKAAVRSNSIPFSLNLNPVDPAEAGRNAFMELRRQAAQAPEMTLEEINAEIAAARTSHP